MISFYYLMLAGAGDELQGIKRGIMEMADAIAINKIDSASKKQVQQAVREYKNALHLYPPTESGWSPKVTTCSALESDGVSDIWEMMEEYVSLTKENGYWQERRNRQSKHWMYESINNRLKDTFYNDPSIKKKLSEVEEKVLSGEMSSFKAAQKLLNLYNSQG
ncbi:MAG: hypothetical protein U5J95_11145 [Balneolaceae bacterium]|nr:hypothetical protein [Balneolaceae bacterium]